MAWLVALWKTFPEWGKQLTVVTILGVLAWFFKWAIPASYRAVSKYFKKRHDSEVESRSKQVWAYIKQESHGSTVAFKFATILAQFKYSDREMREALRVLKTKELLTTNFDESLWFSDAKGRFYN